MKKILLLKHWQLFLLFYLVSGIPQIFFFEKIMNSERPQNLIALVSVPSYFVYSFWIYSIGIYIFRIKQEGLNLTRFKISFFFLIIYFFFFLVLFAFIKLDTLFASAWAVGFVILHLIAIFCYLYCAYFIARLLNSIEQKKSVGINEILGDIFFILFFPLGVWFVQPRLNKIIRFQNSATSL